MSAITDGLARAASDGSPAARLAVMDADVGRLGDLPRLAATLGNRVIVRSSSPLERSGTWSGAFTSFLDVRPEEILTAVRGVWASALGESVLRRPDTDMDDPTSLRLAVLVQPQVQPEFSGTAEVARDGSVTVVAVAGSPAPLMSGWDPGVVARRERDGTVRGEATAMGGGRLVRRVANLAEAVRRELGDGLVEWAAVDGEIVLLQSKVAIRTAVGPAMDTAEDLPENAVQVAYHAVAHAGPAGDRLVLPWLLVGAAQGHTPEAQRSAGAVSPDEALAAWEEAVRLARALTAEIWRNGSDPTREGGGTLAALRGEDPADALRRLSALPPIDPVRATRTLTLFGQVARHLVERGAIRQARYLWALPPETVSRLLAGGRHPDTEGAARRAALRWEPFLYAALMNHGARASGHPASPGGGAGPALLVRGRPGRTRLPPRAVLVAPRPLPHLAPLLWGASALVTFGGGVGAHLVEVARSLNVPAVVGCPADSLGVARGEGRPPTLVAVDGNTGTVAVGPETRLRG
ncbi:MAG: PEP-utilizing enzyme [Nocardioidaceae bacterium]